MSTRRRGKHCEVVHALLIEKAVALRRTRADRIAFIKARPWISAYLLPKVGVPLYDWCKSKEAKEILEVAKAAKLYAPSTVAADMLAGLRGIAREIEYAASAPSEEVIKTALESTDKATAAVIKLMEATGVDTIAVFRRLQRKYDR